MNQNMQQNNQNQVIQQPMTQEELQRTQVLNLQEVEKVAKIEKSTSKKPALFFALLGILSITLGMLLFIVIDELYPRIKDTKQKKATYTGMCIGIVILLLSMLIA